MVWGWVLWIQLPSCWWAHKLVSSISVKDFFPLPLWQTVTYSLGPYIPDVSFFFSPGVKVLHSVQWGSALPNLDLRPLTFSLCSVFYRRHIFSSAAILTDLSSSALLTPRASLPQSGEHLKWWPLIQCGLSGGCPGHVFLFLVVRILPGIESFC